MASFLADVMSRLTHCVDENLARLWQESLQDDFASMGRVRLRTGNGDVVSFIGKSFPTVRDL
jgi:hypothetical protein